MLALRAASARPVAPMTGARPARRAATVRVVVARADPKSPLESAIEEAKETCADGSSSECAVAWDTVEEISAAESHKKALAKKEDPLETFCNDNPDADECRVYED